jgi:7,8-dihydropterin-6-yl-methyl-4-(beta-D-ribofuranosyl)aminobenzene 5'-phosphate synthase
MPHLKKSIGLLALALSIGAIAQEQTAPQRVCTGRVVILSTNIAQEGIGEWGFAALIEADGHRILFDTGARPDTVIKNAREMKINLTDIRDLVLSHSHADHTGGIMTLRRELAKENGAALWRTR